MYVAIPTSNGSHYLTVIAVVYRYQRYAASPSPPHFGNNIENHVSVEGPKLSEMERNILAIIRTSHDAAIKKFEEDGERLRQEVLQARTENYQLNAECQWLWSWNRELVEGLATSNERAGKELCLLSC